MISEPTGLEPVESLPAILARRAQEDGASILIEEVDGCAIDAADFLHRSQGVAGALASLGVQPGECVATLLDASIDAHLCWFGTCWAGAMEVPVNPELRRDLLAYAIRDSRARVVITSTRHRSPLLDVLPDLPDVKHILVVDADDDADAVPLWPLVASLPSRDWPVPALTDPYCVIYTSGTTGPPKGVVVPWGSIQYAATARLFEGDDWAAYDDPAFYSPWPMFHSSGRTGMVFALTRNGRFVIRSRLSTSAFWDDVRRHRCTHAHLLGLADYLLDQPARADDAENPLRRILMNPVIRGYRTFEERFGVVVSTGWGSTEVGFPVAASNLPNHETCGRLSPLYDLRIVDEEERDVQVGTPGQVLLRAARPWLMLTDYIGRPDALARAWAGGWFHTGDVLRQDADGYYYFVDRMADFIRVKGNNVSSLELEQQALKHPEVREVAAVGVRIQSDGASVEDEIKLCVRGTDGRSVDEAALRAFLEPLVPRFMLPRFIQLMDDFPRTPTGKIRKAALRENADDAWDARALSDQMHRGVTRLG